MEGKSNCQKVFFDDNDVNVCGTYVFSLAKFERTATFERKDLRDLQ